MGAEIFHALKKQLHDAGHNTNVGDEGGFAPNLKSADEALGFIVKRDREGRLRARRGCRCWRSIRLPASSSRTANTCLTGEGKTLDAGGMVKVYEDLCARYPIVSIEDGMAEDDWDGWRALTDAIGAKVQLVGDDVFVTNTRHSRSAGSTRAWPMPSS